MHLRPPSIRLSFYYLCFILEIVSSFPEAYNNLESNALTQSTVWRWELSGERSALAVSSASAERCVPDRKSLPLCADGLAKAIELPIDETEILTLKPANKLLAPSISALLARAHVWTLNTTIDDATLRLSFLRDTPLIPTSYLHGQDFRPIFRRNRSSNWRNPLLQQQSTHIPTPRIHSRLRSDIMHGYYSEGLLCLGGCWRIGATHRSLSTALGWLVNSHYLYGLPSGWSKVMERFFFREFIKNPWNNSEVLV